MKNFNINLRALESYFSRNKEKQINLASYIRGGIEYTNLYRFVYAAHRFFGERLIIKIDGNPMEMDAMDIGTFNTFAMLAQKNYDPITLSFSKPTPSQPFKQCDVVFMYDDEAGSWIRTRLSGDKEVDSYPFFIRLAQMVCQDNKVPLNSYSFAIIKHWYEVYTKG